MDYGLNPNFIKLQKKVIDKYFYIITTFSLQSGIGVHTKNQKR